MTERRAARTLALALALLLPAAPGLADRIETPPPGIPRTGPAEFSYRAERPLTGNGTLAVEWTDVHGRVVERRALPVTLTGGATIPFTLDLRRAAAMRNTVRARLALNAVAPAGGTSLEEGQAEATFIARPSDDPWRDYQVIMWQSHDARQYATLKELGISAGAVIPQRDDPGREMAGTLVDALLQNDLRWYLENTATDFYAAYHRWTPGKPVNWLYEEARQIHRADPASPLSRLRTPSLADPEWLARIAVRLKQIVQHHRPYAPLYYSLADEAGIADLSANWDFDFATPSLAGFRAWLEQGYGTLSALNRQWGTAFAGWEAIVPPTTTEAMRRRDENYSAWSDFKDWMNESFARAARHGVGAVQAADAEARAALEGMQVTGWGGYDYARLADAVDLMEIYDVAGNGDVVRSLNAGVIRLVTSFGGKRDDARLWRHWLRGGRGAILWDDNASFVDAAGNARPRGLSHRAQFHELRHGLGALLINSAPRTDPIALLYSPASCRARWMLDYRHLGDAWVQRDAEREHEDDTLFRAASRGFLAAAREARFQPRFISEHQLERGLEGPDAPRILILPHILALSERSAEQIRRFAARGGAVLADIVPGDFDQHVRRRAAPVLAGLFDRAGSAAAAIVDPNDVSGVAARIGDLVRRSGLRPPAQIVDAAGGHAEGVELFAYRSGNATIIGAMNANDDRGAPRALTLRLDRPALIRDIRRDEAFARADRADFTLNPQAPALFAVLAVEPEPLALAGPVKARAGETAGFAVERQSAGETVLRLDVVDPTGKRVEPYSRTLVAGPGRTELPIPFAVNDAEGTWQVSVTEILTGRRSTTGIALARP